MSLRDLSLEGLISLRNRSRDPGIRDLPNTGRCSVTQARERLLAGPWKMTIGSFRRKGFHIHRPVDPIDRLLIEGASESLRAVTGARQADRHEVVAKLKLILGNGCPYRVFRMDIKAFYESIDRERVKDRLAKDLSVPILTSRVIDALFDGCSDPEPDPPASAPVPGIPRGVPLSALLAEDYLRRFDAELNRRPDGYFYCRYVDDIIFIASPSTEPRELREWVGARLNDCGGLSLNRNKTADWLIDGGNHRSDSVEFTYLGYQFSIETGKKKPSRVDIDIAPAKIRRMKTRVCKAASAFLHDGDFGLLEDRLRALTGNYPIPGRRKGRPIWVGIYFSYPEVSEQSSTDGGLTELDSFLKCFLHGSSTRLSRRLRKRLSKSQLHRLSRLSFVHGFEFRRRLDFSPLRASQVVSCWRHV